jgi:hypothetical protein
MGSARRLVIGALAAMAGFFVARPTPAMPLADGELRVQRSENAADCPDEPALANATLALGSYPQAASTTSLSVVVDLDRDAEGYVARIRTTGRKEGYREIRAPGESCVPLAEATSVAVAILFDLLPPESESPPPPLEPRPAAVPAVPAPAPAPKESPKPSPPREAAPAKQFASLSTEAGVAYGLLGSAFTVHFGGSIHLALGERGEMNAGGFWAPGRSIDFEPGRVVVSLAAGRAGGLFWLLRSDHFDLGARAELSIGSIHGEGRDFDHPGDASELWTAGTLGASGRYAFNRRWGFRFGLALVVPFRRQSFTVTTGDEAPAGAYESTAVAAMLELGPELFFF